MTEKLVDDKEYTDRQQRVIAEIQRVTSMLGVDRLEQC